MIDSRSVSPNEGLEHLAPAAVAVLRWLVTGRVDFVLVGPVARAIRGDLDAQGPVGIVPAPYGRNLDRLARMLNAARARARIPSESGSAAGELKLEPETLLRARRWALRCGDFDLDIEGWPAGSPRYQELLYESSRLAVAPELFIEVAAPEDIEHYDHVRRHGTAPEIRVTRNVSAPEAG